MNRIASAIIIGTFFVVGAVAQDSPAPAEAQANAQSSQQGSAQASRQGAKAAGVGDTTASAKSGQNSASLAQGSSFNAELTSPVDSKKAKPGDAVNGRTTEAVKSDGKVILPKGTKVVGHVTQASARSEGEAQSALGIVFDKAVLKNGQEVPLSVAIQAVAAAQSSANIAGSDMEAMGNAGASAAGSGVGAGRGAVGGVAGNAAGNVAGSTAGTVTNTAGTARGIGENGINSTVNSASNVAGSANGTMGGLNAAGQLTSNSRGVFGLNGVALSSAATGDAQGSVFTSSGKSVHLDSGTRILLVTQSTLQSSAQSQPGKSGEAKATEPKPESRPRAEKP